ncbi:hypothetical protein GGS20DRAFT_588519 [Poronia punctata]|nr:hypothetical protein GGS20DRAFT_588519 [Poronia punctata]
MKYLAFFAPFALGAVALPRSQTSTTQAKINGFDAHTKAGGNGASISYNLQIDGQVDTHCHYADETSGTKLPAVDRIPCDDESVSWQMRQDPSQPGTEGRYRILIFLHDTNSATGKVDVGFHEWLAKDFVKEIVGSQSETVYKGVPDFTVTLSS